MKQIKTFKGFMFSLPKLENPISLVVIVIFGFIKDLKIFATLCNRTGSRTPSFQEDAKGEESK